MKCVNCVSNNAMRRLRGPRDLSVMVSPVITDLEGVEGDVRPILPAILGLSGRLLVPGDGGLELDHAHGQHSDEKTHADDDNHHHGVT